MPTYNVVLKNTRRKKHKYFSFQKLYQFKIEGVIEVIEFDLYVKPTDSHQYLQSSSYHPFHC